MDMAVLEEQVTYRMKRRWRASDEPGDIFPLTIVGFYRPEDSTMVVQVNLFLNYAESLCQTAVRGVADMINDVCLKLREHDMMPNLHVDITTPYRGLIEMIDRDLISHIPWGVDINAGESFLRTRTSGRVQVLMVKYPHLHGRPTHHPKAGLRETYAELAEYIVKRRLDVPMDLDKEVLIDLLLEYKTVTGCVSRDDHDALYQYRLDTPVETFYNQAPRSR